MKEQSIESIKKSQSVTYLVFSNDDASLVGYFTLVIKPLQELFFQKLEENVLWIDAFSEIPILLKQIKGNYDSY